MAPSIRNLSVSPRVLIALFVTLSLIMVSSAVIELRQSRQELRSVMVHQAHSLLESLQVAAGNALNASEHLETSIRHRLLDNADFVRRLYESNRLSDETLRALARQHHIHRIRVVRPDGSWAFSSHPRIPEHDTLSPPRPDLSPIFSGVADTMIISLRQARAESGSRHGVALAARDRSAIVLNLDAEQLQQFRQDIGLGPMLLRITEDPNIVYVALQDTAEILAAAGETDLLESISEDPFLNRVWTSVLQDPHDRVLANDSTRVLEIAHPFIYGGTIIGVFRVGLSLKPMDAIDGRIVRRLIIITLIILVIGFILVAFIVARQNADLVARQYEVVETYSSQVIDRVGDGIIVFNEHEGVQTINPAALKLLSTTSGDALRRPIAELLPGEACRQFLHSAAVRDQVACELPHGLAYLLLGKTTFKNEKGVENTILILRDQTRLRELESQVRLRERTQEMSALASGLAHEIRNPLNAVGTIVQQLRKDFTPMEGVEDYNELTALVYSEVRRINDAIQGFLQTVRPKPAQPEPFEIEELLRFAEHAFETAAQEQGVEFVVEAGWKGVVAWDQDQMRHVLMNLVQNALDACSRGDRIVVRSESSGDDRVEICVSDTGIGIPKDIQGRVFNLYFTTKASGTGIGLSMVERVVTDHGGTITLSGDEGVGTTFALNLPLHAGRSQTSPQLP